MGAVLHIESEAAARDAAELASLRHVSVDEAVTRVLHEAVVQERVKRIKEWARVIRENLHTPLTMDATDELYGEDGLPL